MAKLLYVTFFGSSRARDAHLDECEKHSEVLKVDRVTNTVSLPGLDMRMMVYDGRYKTMEKMRGMQVDGWRIDTDSLPSIDTGFLMQFITERVKK